MRLKIKKIDAGALQYAIAVSVIIGGILSAFLLYTHIQLKFSKQSEWANSSIKLSEDGLRYAETHKLPYLDTVFFQRDNNAEIALKKSHWGIYNMLASSGSSNNYKHSSKTLLGLSQPKDERRALQMPNNDQPLVLVGKSALFGNVQISEQGVKAGSIGGTYYQNTILVNGNQLEKFGELPLPSKEKLAHLKDLLEGKLPADFEDFTLNSDKTIERSFDEPTGVISSTEAIYLDDISLTGNIIVISKKAIEISAFAKAQHILFIAPEIRIAANANLQLQAFASKSIVVEKGAQLSYPSALVLTPKDSLQTNKPRITLENNASIEGSVLFLKEEASEKRETEVLISEGAIVYGEVYSQGYLELKGSVYGSVYTNYFIASYKGSSYINHIMDGSIDSRNIPEDFGGLIGLDNNHKNLLWLD